MVTLPLRSRSRRLPRWLAAGMLAGVLALAPGVARAQGIAGPRPSVIWTAPVVAVRSDSTHATGWNRSKGAAVGAVVGALAGAFAGHWVCQQYGTNGPESCAGSTVWGATLFGTLGLLLGALAGADAEQ